MAENEASFKIKKVDSVQVYIKNKYSDNIGLATSILGQVLLGTLRGTKRRKEVIKLCSKDMKQQFVDRVAENPYNEIAFMRKVCSVGHPGLCRFIDAVEDKKLYCLCLEYVPGGDLCTHLQNKRSGLSNELSQQYALQLTQAVYFMHCCGYCHLDISLENVLWDKKNDVVKLCDFGLCRRFPEHERSQLFPAANIRPGKKGYIAPEIYAYQRFNGEKADVFSLGVLIFILLTGFPPFTTPNASDKCFQYMYYGKLEWLLKQWKLDDVINADCRALLSKIFCHPNKRIGIRDMLQHPWMKANLGDIDAQVRKYQQQMAASSASVSATTTTATPLNTPPTTTSTTPTDRRMPQPQQQPQQQQQQQQSTTSSLPSKKRKSITTIVKVKKKRSGKHHSTSTTTTIATAAVVPTSTSPSPSSSASKVGIRPSSEQHHKQTRQRRAMSVSMASLCESHTLLSEFAALVSSDEQHRQRHHHHCSSRSSKCGRSKSLSYSQPIHFGVEQSHALTINNKQIPSTAQIRDESPVSPLSNCKHADEYKRNWPNRGDGVHETRKTVDTQLISELHGQFKSKQHNEYDDDRKEGDDETYPSDEAQHERNSVTSCDEERRYSIASHHTDSGHAATVALGGDANEFNNNDEAAPNSTTLNYSAATASAPAAVSNSSPTVTTNIEELTLHAHSNT
eukprot:CAMPEP_0202686248 /NCGR_PEP_ID=MMETSP1385-20130828/2056_1 /ASSEMBLY_ACC=CAM_ASM_000861 /TAXON_ID=933848 /ORGANISM="Elphidium margaritaceum" /LENGTH=678 /DNA_ID=CAMNT_0049340781 /DNA_START=184 /DNA_END=2220 /DNA_ORIENTATION=+